MATQYVAANGESLQHALSVDNCTLKSLGIDHNMPLPKGLVGFDVDSGLAIVKTSPDAKCVQMRIGKLLKRLGKPEAEITSVGNNANKIKQMAKLPLLFTTTSEEVIDVYKRGPQSCMKDCDAVGVYATDDVAVAYLECEGVVVARSVVCKNEDIGLQYVCAYGLVDVIEASLERAGYSKGTLDGCKILLIESDEGGYVMPYLDGNANEVDIGCDFATVTTYGGDYTCDSTSGQIGESSCDECENLFAENDPDVLRPLQ